MYCKVPEYVEETSSQLKGLRRATECFEKVAEKYGQLTKLFPFSGCNGSGCTINRNNVPEGLALVKECKAIEEEAFEVIKAEIERSDS